MIRNIVKSLLPNATIKALKVIHFKFTLLYIKLRQKQALCKISKKEKIKVAFFIINEQTWKCDGLYSLMERNKRFSPIIIVTPWTVFGEENMLKEMESCYNFFFRKGYNVVRSFNKETGEWLNVKKDIKPDIIMFTNPYALTKKEYYIDNFKPDITYYIPYGYTLANIQQSQFNLDFHNFIWKGFYETTTHKRMAEKYARNKGKNIEISGAPLCDIFLDKSYVPKDRWKIKEKSVKRIIWAPHHTIEDNKEVLAYSNFLSYHQFMLKLLEQYKGEIQIAFKPHPILKRNLYKHPNWGRKKTDEYYKKWENRPNGQLEESDYEDLFLTSDALILDSISFITEYYFTHKPSLFMIRDKSIYSKFNEFGEIAFNFMYKSHNQNELINFVEHIVINKNDTLSKERENFVNTYLKPPNNKSANQNIFDSIVNEVK